MNSISGKWPIICTIIAGITILGIFYMVFIIAPKRKQEAEQEREQIRQERLQRAIAGIKQDVHEKEIKLEELARKQKQESELEDQKRERERQDLIGQINEKRRKEGQEKLAKQQRLEQIKQNELAKWQGLKIGMIKSQVEKILGKPKSIDTYNAIKREMWMYSAPEGFYGNGNIVFEDGKLSSWNAP